MTDDEKDLKHVGVMGMHWGRSSGSKYPAIPANRKTQIRTGIGKVVNSKAFKTLVYDKSNTTGLIFNKSEVNKLKANVVKGKATVDKFLNSRDTRIANRSPLKQKLMHFLTGDPKIPMAKKLAYTTLATVGAVGMSYLMVH